LIVDDKVMYISSMGQFHTYGFNLSKVVAIGDTEMDRQARGGNLPGVRVTCGDKRYIISDGKKYLVSDAILNEFGGAVGFTAIECKILDVMRTENMTRFITSPGNKNIYYVTSGRKRHIQSWQTFLGLGGASSNVITLHQFSFESIPTGDVL